MNFNNLTKTITGLLLVIILTGCLEIKTDNPQETYKYWSGTNLPSNLELLNGQYWQSAHWTKEYIMYLEFKPSDAPIWFRPSENSIRFGGYDDFDQGSRYLKDTLTGVCYIYEIQI